jgi:hypothetical protein
VNIQSYQLSEYIWPVARQTPWRQEGDSGMLNLTCILGNSERSERCLSAGRDYSNENVTSPFRMTAQAPSAVVRKNRFSEEPLITPGAHLSPQCYDSLFETDSFAPELPVIQL